MSWFSVNRLEDSTFAAWPAGPWKALRFEEGDWREPGGTQRNGLAARSALRDDALDLLGTNSMLAQGLGPVPAALADATLVARIDARATPGQSLTLRVRAQTAGSSSPVILGTPVRHPEDGAWRTMILTAQVPKRVFDTSLVFEVFRSGGPGGTVSVGNASLEFYMEKPIVRGASPTARDLWLAVALLGIFTVGTIVLFRRIWTVDGRGRRVGTNAALVFGSLSLTLLLLELVFRFAYVQTDRFGAMWVSRHWVEKYWTPKNSGGFRDVEHSSVGVVPKKLLFVLGDSFAAGHGVRDANDRFPDIVGRELGDTWEMVLLAKSGWSTADELEALRSTTQRPDAIVLSYVFNDIEGAARARGKLFDLSSLRPCPVTQAVIDRSYFADFLYWRIAGIRLGGASLDAQRDDLYRDAGVWSAHETELSSIVDFAKVSNTPLVVILFPRLGDVTGSAWIVDKVGAYLSAKGAVVVNMGEYVRGLPHRQLVVNPSDHHPSEWVHRSTSEKCLAVLRPLLVDAEVRSRTVTQDNQTELR